MNVDPKWLQQQVAASRGEALAARGTDKPAPCHKCGYDLRGLPPGKLCPECGSAPPGVIPGKGKVSGVKRLMMAPSEQLTRLSLAGSLCGYGFTAFAAGMLGAWVLGALRVMDWAETARSSQTALTIWALLGAIAWVAGVWLITAIPLVRVGDAEPATSLSFVPKRSRSLAWSARGSQCFWVIGVALTLASTYAETKGLPWADAARYLAILSVVVAAIATGAVAVILREVALAVDDDFAAGMMVWGVWGFPAAGFFCAVAAMLGPYLNWGMGLLNLTGLAYTLAMIPLPAALVAGLWSLGTTCRWAGRNAREMAERERRFREKAEAAARAAKAGS